MDKLDIGVGLLTGTLRGTLTDERDAALARLNRQMAKREAWKKLGVGHVARPLRTLQNDYTPERRQAEKAARKGDGLTVQKLARQVAIRSQRS